MLRRFLHRLLPSSEAALTVGIGATTSFTVFFYSVMPTKIDGPSMLPTLAASHEIALSERISTRQGWLQHGDIVVAHSVRKPSQLVIKRIVGLPGDRFTLQAEALTQPPRWSPGRRDKDREVVVPDGHVWLHGDNLEVSRDSRTYGLVPMAMLRSRVYAVLNTHQRSVRWAGRTMEFAGVERRVRDGSGDGDGDGDVQ